MGGGESNSTSLPLPLSILGKNFSLEDSDEELGSSVEEVAIPFFWISLMRCAMRSETLAVR